jgi:hypothetical protein
MSTTATHHNGHAGSNGHTKVSVPNLVNGVKRTDEKIVAFVQERPVTALCAAIAVGYFVGRVFTKLT